MPPLILATPAFSVSSVGRLRLGADGLSVLGVVRVLGRCFRRVAQRWLIACGYLLLPVVDLLRADGLWLRLVLPLQSPDFSRVRGSPFAIRPFISVQIRADGRYRLGTTIGCGGGPRYPCVSPMLHIVRFYLICVQVYICRSLSA